MVQPAKEKVKRTRTVLAHMSYEEKTERRKEVRPAPPADLSID